MRKPLPAALPPLPRALACFALPVVFAIFISFAAVAPAHADLVVLVDGDVMKVAAFQANGDLAELTFPSGGRMTMPIDRVDRVVDDEVIPEPPKKAVEAVAEAIKSALVPLHFEEAQAKVPDGPYGAMIFDAAKRHKLNPQVVAALIRTESSGNPHAVSN